MIGLKRGTVKILPYDPLWEELGRSHCDRIEKALGPLAFKVVHVGSTSVRGLAAKPIIDIAVGVGHFDRCIIDAMESAGYKYRSGLDTEKDMLFVEGDGEWRSAHVHVVGYMSIEWRNYVNFKHYLIAFPKARDAYAALKTELAARYANDRNAYTEAKAAFITHALRKAMVWSYLGKYIEAKIDRPIGYLHVKGDKQLLYPINYGYIPGVFGGDGEELDVYCLGATQPLEQFTGKVIAIVHRADDVEDKLVACSLGRDYDVHEICREIYFQEKFYDTTIETVNGQILHISNGVENDS